MWDTLLTKLDSRKITLTSQRDLMTVFNEMDECLTDMGIIQVLVESVVCASVCMCVRVCVQCVCVCMFSACVCLCRCAFTTERLKLIYQQKDAVYYSICNK